MFLVRIQVGEPTPFLGTTLVHTVYVLRNPDGRLYVGHTADLTRRLEQHSNGESRWTASRGPWELAHTEDFDSRAAAMAREKALKTGRANQELRDLLRGRGC
ncbi:MAG: GIY-YIG nuclease family protein [Dehalococcoidia bacterium]